MELTQSFWDLAADEDFDAAPGVEAWGSRPRTRELLLDLMRHLLEATGLHLERPVPPQLPALD